MITLSPKQEADMAGAAMAGLTNSGIADLLSVSRSTIARWVAAEEGDDPRWRYRQIILGGRARRLQQLLKAAEGIALTNRDTRTLMKLIERLDRIIDTGGAVEERAITVNLDSLRAKLAGLE